jgi:hypothetical protein
VGDRVTGKDGRSTQVTGTFPRGVRETYSVEFDDGFAVEVSDDHLWQVQAESCCPIVLSTKHMLRTDKQIEAVCPTTAEPVVLDTHYLDKEGQPKWHIPLVDAVVFDVPQMPLPVNAYLMGLIVACGQKRQHTGEITLHMTETADSCLKQVGSGDAKWTVNSISGQSHVRIVDALAAAYVSKLFEPSIEDEQLEPRVGLSSIPAAYLKGSVADRSSLLRGVLDASGTVSSTGLQWVGREDVFRKGLAELVQSVGGVARLQSPAAAADGGFCSDSAKDGLVRVAISLPHDIAPFSIPKKSQAYSKYTAVTDSGVFGSGGLSRRVVRISPCRKTDVMCISVAAADHLYVTEHFIVTHNTIQVKEHYGARLLNDDTIIFNGFI